MISLLTHVNPDGDALGAVFAARELLATVGQDSTVYLWGDLPRWFGQVHALLGSPPYETGPATPGPAWLLDASSLKRCGEGNVTYGVEVLVLIDHHPDEGQAVSESRFIDTEASSACEMLAFRWPRALGGAHMTPHAAGWLYLGMRTDSLGFTTDRVSERTHRRVSRLIEDGAPHVEIAAAIHRSMTRAHLGFIAECLDAATWRGTMVVIPVERHVRAAYGVGENDTKMILSLTGQLCDTDLTVLLIEADDGRTLISARSHSEGRAQALARSFGGGGHPKAAGAAVPQPLAAVLAQIAVLTQ